MDRSRFPSPPAVALDTGLAVVVTALELSDLLVFNSGNRRTLVTILLLLLSAAPLVLWRRRPLIAFQLTAWSTVALAARHDTHIGLGPIAATYGVACWGATLNRRVTAVALLVAVWLVPLLTSDNHSIPTNAALFSAAWVLGALMRDRRVQTAALHLRTIELAREREEKAALATENERARIARELHDVLTHSVSVMVIQAQAAQTPEPDTAQMTTALQRIEAVGKETLAELRTLLRQIRPSAESPARQPQPGLDRIGELVDAVRGAGVDVQLIRDGAVRSVPTSVALSAYRIVQEALTNTMRHTPGAHAQVALHYRPSELVVEVRDDGLGVPVSVSGEGRGIAGMRERAAAVGGTLVAEPCLQGGFRVVASLPFEPAP
jgi:signal transduction histidine kinase